MYIWRRSKKKNELKIEIIIFLTIKPQTGVKENNPRSEK